MLNYVNAQALVNAFNQGAKFKVTGSKYDGPVTAMRVSLSGNQVVVRTTQNMLFSAAGRRYYAEYSGSLIRDESLGFMQSPNAPAAPKATLPFLQRFVTGSPAYCPKTRETVDSIVFREGVLEVGLVLGGKVGRTSTNYRHDGTHKHDPARNLVIGKLPPPPKPDVEVPVYVFESTVMPGTFIAATLNQFTVAPEAWRQVGFAQVVAQGKQRG